MSQPVPVVMMIADISGFTGFMLGHRKALSHSQQIIGELLQTIIDQAVDPLQVCKLEGDAVFLYALKPEGAGAAFRDQLGERVQAIFAGYAEILQHLQRENICRCAACDGLDRLRLKLVVHSGEAVLTDYNGTDLHGVDPIVIHRLLKNSVDASQYLMLSEAARDDVALPATMPLTEHRETYGDIGEVRLWVATAEALGKAMACEIRPMGPTTLPWDILRGEVQEEYGVIASDPTRDFHFDVGHAELVKCEYREEDIAAAPPEAARAFLGTGNPFAIGRLPEGANVVDIGCGAGMDVSVAARQVGPTGRVIGVDMTPEMLAVARRVFADEAWANVEIREGFAEALPVEDGWADAVISNGVFNLCPDKVTVLREMFRVLKPGGRLQLADICVPRPLRPDERTNIDLWKG